MRSTRLRYDVNGNDFKITNVSTSFVYLT